VELPNLSPNLVTLGDIFEPLPATASPVSVWLGKDISGAAVWTDLARMPHLRPAARAARRRAPDPDRPEADRAQPLRIGPASAHPGRLEPEGGERGPRQLPRRDGAPLRAPLVGAGAQHQRGEPRLPPAG